MSRLSTFFNDKDTRLGVFYPTNYLLAVFPNREHADTAKRELQKAGVLEDEVISVSGEEVVRFATTHAIDEGLWGLIMSKLSRAIGTEAVYSDEDLNAARNGAAFVGVHCPTDDLKARAWKSLELQHPMAARYYAFAGIEHLAGEN